MTTCIQTKIADFIVTTGKICDGQFIAYRVDENGAFDFDHIGFGHGETSRCSDHRFVPADKIISALRVRRACTPPPSTYALAIDLGAGKELPGHRS